MTTPAPDQPAPDQPALGQPAPDRPPDLPTLGAAEIGALAHLYRSEVYRGTVWRTRLDTTTNWSVVTLGVALSLTYAAPEASALPLLLVGILILVFLLLEARRYRYYSLWRARSRAIERNFFVPLLRDGDARGQGEWRALLAQDYDDPDYHIGFLTAVGRRLRSNYLWIIGVQQLAYLGKLVVHPSPATRPEELVDRAAVGPLPGLVVLLLVAAYVATLATLAVRTLRADHHRARLGDEAPRG
jgi:uncharacterized membrane protein